MPALHRACAHALTALAVLGCAWQTHAVAQVSESTCGPLRSAAQYGPFDYRTQQDKLPIVEIAHFTPIVESLIRGQNSGIHAGGDIDYTLRAFPNHHRALDAMVRYGEKMRSDTPPGTHYPVECYFERALRFTPDDAIARMLYASYLAKQNRAAEADSQLAYAAANAAGNAFTQFNIGLIYFDLKQYDKALVQAHKAMQLGFPRSLLIDKLKSIGKWSEPAPAAADRPDAASAASPEPASSAAHSSGGSN